MPNGCQYYGIDIEDFISTFFRLNGKKRIKINIQN